MMELFTVPAIRHVTIQFAGAMRMSDQYGSKSSNGGKDKSTARAAATTNDIQEDLEALQQDVSKLTQQIADIVATKGTEVWRRARANVDGMIGEAGAKGREAADAVRDVTDTLAEAIDDSIARRPYTTLALALGLGFLLGAAWRR
jgi:ElaB/YqjD/DUF883 family membrane-anchored ribosome-binding protein